MKNIAIISLSFTYPTRFLCCQNQIETKNRLKRCQCSFVLSCNLSLVVLHFFSLWLFVMSAFLHLKVVWTLKNGRQSERRRNWQREKNMNLSSFSEILSWGYLSVVYLTLDIFAKYTGVGQSNREFCKVDMIKWKELCELSREIATKKRDIRAKLKIGLQCFYIQDKYVCCCKLSKQIRESLISIKQTVCKSMSYIYLLCHS